MSQCSRFPRSSPTAVLPGAVVGLVVQVLLCQLAGGGARAPPPLTWASSSGDRFHHEGAVASLQVLPDGNVLSVQPSITEEASPRGSHPLELLRRSSPVTTKNLQSADLQTRQQPWPTTAASTIIDGQSLFNDTGAREDEVADTTLGSILGAVSRLLATRSTAILGDKSVFFTAPAAGSWMLPAGVLAVSVLMLLVLSVVILYKIPGAALQVEKLEQLEELPRSSVSSPLHLMCISALNFGYGFMLINQCLLLLPKEASHLYPHNSAVALGAFLVVVSISQVAGPLAGRFADSYRHPLGRRRPLIIVQSCLILTTTAGMWLASELQCGVLLVVFLFIQQVSWNALFATQQGLVSDLVDSSAEGAAAGCQTAMMIIGALIAIASFYAVAHLQMDFHLLYCITLSGVFLGLPVVYIAGNEASSMTAELPTMPAVSKPLEFFKGVYGWDMKRYPDWTRLASERSIYYAGVVIKPFMVAYLHEGFGVKSDEEVASLLAQVGVIGEAVCASSALFASVLMDKYGVRKRLVACVSALIMAVTYHVYVATFFETTAARKAALLVNMTIFGVGQGAYLSSDLALAFATMPDTREASRYLSLWGVSALIGGTVGSIAMSLLMQVFGRNIAQSWLIGHKLEAGHYDMLGYVAISCFASICMIAVAIIVLGVRTREEREAEARGLTASTAEEQEEVEQIQHKSLEESAEASAMPEEEAEAEIVAHSNRAIGVNKFDAS